MSYIVEMLERKLKLNRVWRLKHHFTGRAVMSSEYVLTLFLAVSPSQVLDCIVDGDSITCLSILLSTVKPDSNTTCCHKKHK